MKKSWIPAFAGMTVAGCSPSLPSQPHTDQIVSTNPCLDAILVELVPPERIAAISHYSQDPRASSMSVPLARRLRATSGTAEEVIALRPGLVLASSFTSPATLAAYKRLGVRTVTFGTAATTEENRTQIREIARVVDAQAQGEALIARIDRAVADAESYGPDRPSALLWLGSSNLVNGSGTLIDELMRRAGFRNASADYGVRQTGVLPLELVVAHPPQVVLAPRGDDAADSLRVRALGAGKRKPVIGAFSERLFYCGGPSIIPAMRRLAEIRRTVS